LEQNSSFIFDVHSANKNWEIEDQDDLDAFFEELACLSFVPPQNETAAQSGAGDMYVFSTSCDLMLSTFIVSRSPRPVSLFLVQPGNLKTKKEDIEILRIQDFVSKGCYPPSRWFAKQKIKPLNIQNDKIEMFYAGIKA